jgi:hypothetical protein
MTVVQPAPEDMVNRYGACDLLDINERELTRLIQTGALKVHKGEHQRHWFVRAEIMALAAERPPRPQQPPQLKIYRWLDAHRGEILAAWLAGRCCIETLPTYLEEHYRVCFAPKHVQDWVERVPEESARPYVQAITLARR